MKFSNFKFEGKDSRGKVWSFKINGIEYILFKTNNGYLRGGDFHSAKQYNTVLQGTIDFISRQLGLTVIDTLKTGETIIIEKNIPHYMTSIGESWVLEWHELPKTRTIYQPYRKLVEESKNGKE